VQWGKIPIAQERKIDYKFFFKHNKITYYCLPPYLRSAACKLFVNPAYKWLMITLAIVDDSALFRNGLKALITSKGDFTVVSDTANGKEALAYLHNNSIHPDVILMDIRMPEMDGKQATSIIHAGYPEIKIIALSLYHHEDVILEMFECGAIGFISKNIEYEVLVKAIHAVMNQQKFIAGEDMEKNIELNEAAIGAVAFLTEKQKCFLQFCATDLTYKQIGEQMNLSPKTIDRYRDDLFKKLNIKSKTGLAIYAIQTGLVNI